jgi:hypothetical protein
VGGTIITMGLKKYLAVSLHILILLYTSHSKENWSSFKTDELAAFQNSETKAQKSPAS